MSNRCFGDFHEAVCRDDLRPALGYGIVYDGRIVCTNTHILICNSLSLWLEDDSSGGREHLSVDEQLFNLEGKAFSFDLLKKLTNAKIKKLRFEADKIIAFNTKNDVFEEFYYSAVSFAHLGYERLEKEPKNKSLLYLYSPIRSFRYVFQTINPHTGQLDLAKKEKESDPDVPNFFTFPVFQEVFPAKVINKATLEFNFSEFCRPDSPHLFMNADLLHKIAKTFISPTLNVVTAYTTENRPIFVFPNERDWSPEGTKTGDEFGFLMPVINKQFNI